MKRIKQENYFSPENNIKYAGYSQIKSFLSCEKAALAELTGEWIEEKSESLLVSSYLDEKISGTLDDFIQKNPEVFTKQGELKAQYKHIEDIYNEINSERNNIFKKYLNGEHQVIMTGSISNVPVKIKIDSYFKDKCIVDLKCVKDFNLIFNEKTHEKQNFIDYYDYILQASLYQEICYQATGKRLPFIIAACTKEKYPQFALLQIPQQVMDEKLEFLKQYLPHLQEVKQGKVKPTSCGKCNYCISQKKCDRIYYYDDFWNQEIKI